MVNNETTPHTGLISPEDLPQWVPGEVQSSSKGLIWKDLSQCTYRYAGQDVELPPMGHCHDCAVPPGRHPDGSSV